MCYMIRLLCCVLVLYACFVFMQAYIVILLPCGVINVNNNTYDTFGQKFGNFNEFYNGLERKKQL